MDAQSGWDLERVIAFIRRDVWRIPADKLPRKQSFLLKQLRTVILAVRGFDEDKCSLRASALTFYSLLSIVPFLAMAFGIAKGFHLEKRLEGVLYERFQGQEEVLGRVIGFANSMLEETRGGLIAGIGVAILFYLIVKLLSNIENSFNDIWGVTHARKLGRKFSDYLSVMLICPLLLVMSSSLTVFVSTQVAAITLKIDVFGILSPVVGTLLEFLPYCVIWLLFTFVYVFMPNTKVHFRSAFLGGIVAGTIYQLVQWGYIAFQIGVNRYGAIYGSFAALPLFLIWLQLSWLIVLFGAEISFASQNVETYEFEPDALQTKPSFKRLLALRIAQVCVKNFCDGERPWCAEEISHALEIPIRLVNLILDELVEGRILTEVMETVDGEPRFQPARNVDTLTIHSVLRSLEQLGTDSIPVAQSDELNKLSDCLGAFGEIVARSEANLALKDI
jgi:membrane protein